MEVAEVYLHQYEKQCASDIEKITLSEVQSQNHYQEEGSVIRFSKKFPASFDTQRIQ